MEPFEYTATGVLGDKRDTMLQNQLLLRNELGRPMRRGYTAYPGDTFRYGRPNAVKDGGAAEALTQPLAFSNLAGSGGLYFHRKKEAGKEPERDFMALNRSAVQAGLTKAPEYYQFRATHDIRRKVQPEDGNNGKLTRRIPPTQVYGISTRPSTPIHDLLEHKYQDRWLGDRRSAELTKKQKAETQRLTPGKVYETRASMLRNYQVPVQSAPLWQMPKFSNCARPHLETFRTSQAKDDAFKGHQSDRIARKGVIGQGIYEPACN